MRIEVPLILALAAVVSSPAGSQDSVGECRPSETRTTVALRQSLSNEQTFYYRLDRHVVYITRAQLLDYFRDGPVPSEEIADVLLKHDASSEIEDVFRPFLDNLNAWYQLQFMLASALESGTGTVTGPGGAAIAVVIVEKYITSGCTTGRRFWTRENELLFSVIDSEA